MLPSNDRIISGPGTQTGRDAIVAAWKDARGAGFISSREVVSTWNALAVVVGLLAILSVMVAALV
ncbi:hypothetical protein [Arthrobacter sp. L77]|uniref:hypothetical protein n=1 Tax=Arthrobacter sp. L77 TaxID=1496689 RepID=UPI0005BD66B1|nr:hypothetical protein [Arthrobacter sp. L77]